MSSHRQGAPPPAGSSALRAPLSTTRSTTSQRPSAPATITPVASLPTTHGTTLTRPAATPTTSIIPRGRHPTSQTPRIMAAYTSHTPSVPVPGHSLVTPRTTAGIASRSQTPIAATTTRTTTTTTTTAMTPTLTTSLQRTTISTRPVTSRTPHPNSAAITPRIPTSSGRHLYQSSLIPLPTPSQSQLDHQTSRTSITPKKPRKTIQFDDSLTITQTFHNSEFETNTDEGTRQPRVQPVTPMVGRTPVLPKPRQTSEHSTKMKKNDEMNQKNQKKLQLSPPPPVSKNTVVDFNSHSISDSGSDSGSDIFEEDPQPKNFYNIQKLDDNNNDNDNDNDNDEQEIPHIQRNPKITTISTTTGPKRQRRHAVTPRAPSLDPPITSNPLDLSIISAITPPQSINRHALRGNNSSFDHHDSDLPTGSRVVPSASSIHYIDQINDNTGKFGDKFAQKDQKSIKLTRDQDSRSNLTNGDEGDFNPFESDNEEETSIIHHKSHLNPQKLACNVQKNTINGIKNGNSVDDYFAQFSHAPSSIAPNDLLNMSHFTNTSSMLEDNEAGYLNEALNRTLFYDKNDYKTTKKGPSNGNFNCSFLTTDHGAKSTKNMEKRSSILKNGKTSKMERKAKKNTTVDSFDIYADDTDTDLFSDEDPSTTQNISKNTQNVPKPSNRGSQRSTLTNNTNYTIGGDSMDLYSDNSAEVLSNTGQNVQDISKTDNYKKNGQYLSLNHTMMTEVTPTVPLFPHNTHLNSTTTGPFAANPHLYPQNIASNALTQPIFAQNQQDSTITSSYIAPITPVTTQTSTNRSLNAQKTQNTSLFSSNSGQRGNLSQLDETHDDDFDDFDINGLNSTFQPSLIGQNFTLLGKNQNNEMMMGTHNSTMSQRTTSHFEVFLQGSVHNSTLFGSTGNLNTSLIFDRENNIQQEQNVSKIGKNALQNTKLTTFREHSGKRGSQRFRFQPSQQQQQSQHAYTTNLGPSQQAFNDSALSGLSLTGAAIPHSIVGKNGHHMHISNENIQSMQITRQNRVIDQSFQLDQTDLSVCSPTAIQSIKDNLHSQLEQNDGTIELSVEQQHELISNYLLSSNYLQNVPLSAPNHANNDSNIDNLHHFLRSTPSPYYIEKLTKNHHFTHNTTVPSNFAAILSTLLRNDIIYEEDQLRLRYSDRSDENLLLLAQLQLATSLSNDRFLNDCAIFTNTLFTQMKPRVGPPVQLVLQRKYRLMRQRQNEHNNGHNGNDMSDKIAENQTFQHSHHFFSTGPVRSLKSLQLQHLNDLITSIPDITITPTCIRPALSQLEQLVYILAKDGQYERALWQLETVCGQYALGDGVSAWGPGYKCSCNEHILLNSSNYKNQSMSSKLLHNLEHINEYDNINNSDDGEDLPLDIYEDDLIPTGNTLKNAKKFKKTGVSPTSPTMSCYLAFMRTYLRFVLLVEENNAKSLAHANLTPLEQHVRFEYNRQNNFSAGSGAGLLSTVMSFDQLAQYSIKKAISNQELAVLCQYFSDHSQFIPAHDLISTSAPNTSISPNYQQSSTKRQKLNNNTNHSTNIPENQFVELNRQYNPDFAPLSATTACPYVLYLHAFLLSQMSTSSVQQYSSQFSQARQASPNPTKHSQLAQVGSVYVPTVSTATPGLIKFLLTLAVQRLPTLWAAWSLLLTTITTSDQLMSLTLPLHPFSRIFITKAYVQLPSPDKQTLTKLLSSLCATFSAQSTTVCASMIFLVSKALFDYTLPLEYTTTTTTTTYEIEKNDNNNNNNNNNIITHYHKVIHHHVQDDPKQRYLQLIAIDPYNSDVLLQYCEYLKLTENVIDFGSLLRSLTTTMGNGNNGDSAINPGTLKNICTNNNTSTASLYHSTQQSYTVTIHTILSDYYYLLHDLSASADHLKQALLLSTTSRTTSKLWLKLGLVFFQQHLKKNAINALYNAILHDPDNIQGYYYLSYAAKINKQYTIAIMWLDICTTKNKFNVIYWQELGDCYHAIGSLEQALRCYKYAVHIASEESGPIDSENGTPPLTSGGDLKQLVPLCIKTAEILKTLGLNEAAADYYSIVIDHHQFHHTFLDLNVILFVAEVKLAQCEYHAARRYLHHAEEQQLRIQRSAPGGAGGGNTERIKTLLNECAHATAKPVSA